jgi:Red chlorophyll catabolite reductase (RCC reductase)
MIEQQANLEENKLVFERLLGITNELRQKLEARFELHPNPYTQDLQSYTARVGEAQGSLKTFSGSEIDLLVHGWLHDPKSGFCTMRLTVWLGSHIQVPHLAFEFGTSSHIVFYIDYIPRTDLATDLEYLDCYYEPVNQTYLKLPGRFTI